MPWRVKTVFDGVPGAPYLNTLIFGSASPAQDAVNAVGAFWGAVDNLMHNQIQWRTLPDVDEIGAGGQLLGIATTTPASGAGAVAGDRLPPANQVLVRWRTGSIIGGRELRGRTFCPGFVEASNDGVGTPTAAVLTAVQAAADALIAHAASELSVWSRRHGQFRLVAAATVWSQWAQLRSRRD